MLRANPRVLGSALFSALGLLPLACSGAFSSGNQDGDGGSGGSGAGNNTSGQPAHAGTATSGGRPSGGSASGGSTATGGKPGTAGAASKFPCLNPMQLAGGYEQCESGSIHRPKVAECPSSVPRPIAKIVVPPGDNQCLGDADCVDMPHGYCTSGGQLPGTFCAYGCVNDAECGTGQICACGDPVGHCVGSTCTSDADCGAAFRCQSFDSSHGCGIERFACQSAQDSCGSDADCMGGYCDAASGKFECVLGGCAIGRPFLVEGAERVAPLTSRSDWQQSQELDLSGLSRELRQRAASAWAHIGQMEHASVAAFARFALQLLQLGAPPELVALTSQAMADETSHARLAFGVASQLAGAELGPGPLDIEHSLLETSLGDVVRLVVREGCVGETVASLEAREAAAHASDPRLAALLASVADDEARHAELAWRFVRWALSQSPRAVASVLQNELAEAAARLEESPSAARSAEELALLGLGVVPLALRLELRNATFHEVILPCGRALLAGATQHLPENPVLSA